jgi:CRISPR-associated exonuclease Cas4
MGTYFLVIEDEFKVQPTHEFIVLVNGRGELVENGDVLRSWVLALAGHIRAAKARVWEVIMVDPRPSRCRPCGMRGHCGPYRHNET